MTDAIRREDIAWVACRSDRDGQPTTGPRLCAYSVGDWRVTTAVVPVDAAVFEQDNPGAVELSGNPYSHPWTITHAPTGLGAHECRDLWRAILVCEEVASAFAGTDPRYGAERCRNLLRGALERANRREDAVRAAFDAYNATAAGRERGNA